MGLVYLAPMNFLSKVRNKVRGGKLKDRAYPSAQDQWILTLCLTWFVGGLYLDGWAHNHLSASLETFFTPWHGVFYSGYFVVTGVLLWMTWRNKRVLGVGWIQAIPVGYEYAVLGAGIFFFGGIGDMLWHIVFGIEADIEALLSPTHLLLATGLLLMTSANLLTWWRLASSIDEKPQLSEQLPMLVSLAFILSIVTFMTQFSHPTVPWAAIPRPRVSAENTQSLAVAGYLLQTGAFMSVFFLLLKRAKPAAGAFTIILTLNLLAMVLMRDNWQFALAGVFAGIVADILASHVYPLTLHRRNLRFFAFAVPAGFFTAYFFIMAVGTGIWWSIHMWAGSAVMAGFAGLLLSFVALPMQGENR